MNNMGNSFMLAALIFVIVFFIAYMCIDSDSNRGTKAVLWGLLPSLATFFIGMKYISR